MDNPYLGLVYRHLPPVLAGPVGVNPLETSAGRPGVSTQA